MRQHKSVKVGEDEDTIVQQAAAVAYLRRI
jgi:hypothetical protein